MDIAAIAEIVGITNAGLTTLEKADGLLKKIRGLPAKGGVDGVDANILVAELAEKLMEARMTQLQITNRLAELERDAIATDRFENLLARYATVRLPGGGIVLQLKPDHVGSEPTHEICPRCIEVRQRHFLQPQGTLLNCPNCSATFQNGEPLQGGTIRRRRSGWEI